MTALPLTYASWHILRQKQEPFYGSDFHFFSNQCDDPFSPLIQKEISKAKNSIFLSIYSLQDPLIAEKLEKKALDGLKVTMITDPKSGVFPLQTIKPILKSISALMHQKILIIDEEKILIGSANFTPDSLHIDDNFIVSLSNKSLAKSILDQKINTCDSITYWPLPVAKKEAYDTLCKHIDGAKKSIKVAMFTWTHPELTQKIIEAKKRGIEVLVFLDGKSAEGTSRKTLKTLLQAGVGVYLSPTNKTLHHKMALIDERILFFGSANWTKAAFSKNEECLLMIESLNKIQKKKLEQIFHACKCEARRSKIGD